MSMFNFEFEVKEEKDIREVLEFVKDCERDKDNEEDDIVEIYVTIAPELSEAFDRVFDGYVSGDGILFQSTPCHDPDTDEETPDRLLQLTFPDFEAQYQRRMERSL